MKPRIVILGIALIALGIAVYALIKKPHRSSSTTTVTIGVVVPLTGDAAAFGQNTQRGAELAAMLVTADPGKLNHTYRIVAEDSRGEPTQAAAAMHKVIDVNQARYVIGDVTSAGTQAIVKIATNRHVPVGSPAASAPALSGSSPLFFRVWPSDDYEAGIISAYAQKQGFQRLAIIHANTDYGVAMVEEFNRKLGPAAAPLIIPVERETSNYRPVILRAQGHKPDALFVVLYPEDWKRLLQQLRELNVGLPIMATATIEDPSILREPNAEGIVFGSAVPPQPNDPKRAEFERRYEEKFGVKPGVLSDTGYDVAMLFILADQAAGKEGPEAVVRYIRQQKDYPGISGKMTFDDLGNVRKEYGLKAIRGGQFVWSN